MIKTCLYDDIYSNETNYKVIKYVNSNLYSIIECFIELLDSAKNVDVDIIPNIVNDSENEASLINDLESILSSQTLREYIKPKYEALLYYVMSWWRDLCKDTEEMNIIPNALNESLRLEILNTIDYIDEDGQNYIYEDIMNFNQYFDFCFHDHDFLPENLEQIAMTYINDYDNYLKYYSDVELDDYACLMPNDIREIYLEACKSKKLVKSNLDSNIKNANKVEENDNGKSTINIGSIYSKGGIFTIGNSNEVNIDQRKLKKTKDIQNRSFTDHISKHGWFYGTILALLLTIFATYLKLL